MVLMCLGIATGSISGFFAVKLHNCLPVLMTCAFSFIVVICFVTNILLITLGVAPNTNGKLFVSLWKARRMTKVERKQLQTCAEIGYSIGVIRPVKKTTALNIADGIANCMATLVLMSVSKIYHADCIISVSLLIKLQ